MSVLNFIVLFCTLYMGSNLILNVIFSLIHFQKNQIMNILLVFCLIFYLSLSFAKKNSRFFNVDELFKIILGIPLIIALCGTILIWSGMALQHKHFNAGEFLANIGIDMALLCFSIYCSIRTTEICLTKRGLIQK